MGVVKDTGWFAVSKEKAGHHGAAEQAKQLAEYKDKRLQELVEQLKGMGFPGSEEVMREPVMFVEPAVRFSFRTDFPDSIVGMKLLEA